MGCEKPPRKRDDALKAAEELSDPGRTAIMQFLNAVDDDFWKLQRKKQNGKLLEHLDGSDTTQKDISKVMGVSEKTVSKTKYQLLKDGNVTPKCGRPSAMTEVFLRVYEFIKKELGEGRSVILPRLDPSTPTPACSAEKLLSTETRGFRSGSLHLPRTATGPCPRQSPNNSNGRRAARTPPGRTKVLFESHSRAEMKQFPGSLESRNRSRGGAQRTRRCNIQQKRNGRHRPRPRRPPVPRLVHSRLWMPALLHRHPVRPGRQPPCVLLSAESRLTADAGTLRLPRESACLPRVAPFPCR